MPESQLSFYDLLGVSPNATTAEIDAAYRALLVKIHPDISRLDNLDTRQLAALVNQAWLTLKDPEKRKAYDESLRSPGQRTFVPRMSGFVEDLSDRGRAYVEQLEKSRTLWEATRKRAEAERVAREREAQTFAQARETARLAAERRMAAEAAAEAAQEAAPEPVLAPPPVERAVPWSAILSVVAVLVIALTAAWLLWPRESPRLTIGSTIPQQSSAPTTSAAPQHSRQLPSARPAIASTTPANQVANAPGVKSRAVASTVAPTVVSTIAPTSQPSATIATATARPAPHRLVAVAPEASASSANATCRDAHVADAVSGAVVETDAGSYRVDDPVMQQRIHTWTVGDVVTICKRVAPDGSTSTVLANGARGTVEGVPAGAAPAAMAYGNPPVCTTTVVSQVTNDGATVRTQDGRSYYIQDNEGMRTEVRSWGTPYAVKICSTTERDGSVRASIVGSDTVSVQGSLQKTH